MLLNTAYRSYDCIIVILEFYMSIRSFQLHFEPLLRLIDFGCIYTKYLYLTFRCKVSFKGQFSTKEIILQCYDMDI